MDANGDSAGERSSSSYYLAAGCLLGCLAGRCFLRMLAMFQPQPTPFSSFAPYGVALSTATLVPSSSSSSSSTGPYPAFQVGSGALVVDSGGPTFVRDPVFSRVGANVNVNAGAARASVSGASLAFGATATYNNTTTGNHSKMAEHGLEAQEALARDFQPALEVSTPLSALGATATTNAAC